MTPSPGDAAREAAQEAPVVDPARIDAVLVDLDGVVTETAAIHAEAWKETFDAFLKAREGEGFEPFDSDAEYRRHVDGKPRLDGVRGFLEARGIDLPEGEDGDETGSPTVRGLAAGKNRRFHEKLDRQGVPMLPGARRFLEKARRLGLGIALVTASRNGPAVVEAAGIGEAIDLLVDGNVAAEEGLAGKPAPDTYLEAARRLGVGPDRAAVIEDALAGVEAGRAGGFALVIGIGPASRRDDLVEAGADAVGPDLGAVRFAGDETDG